MLFKEKWKCWEDEEGDVSSYRMTLRKRKCTGIWKRKKQIALSGDLALEEDVTRQTTYLWQRDEDQFLVTTVNNRPIEPGTDKALLVQAMKTYGEVGVELQCNKTFPNSRRHQTFLGVGTVTWGKLHSELPKVLDATVKEACYHDDLAPAICSSPGLHNFFLPRF
jgi:hypothetical protein